MNSKSTVFEAIINQAMSWFKQKSIKKIFEESLEKSKYIPRGLLLICIPVFLGITGLILLISSITLSFNEIYRPYIFSYFSLGVILCFLSLVSNFIFELIISKKIKQIQSQGHKNEISETLKDIFSPLTRQINAEKQIFLANKNSE